MTTSTSTAGSNEANQTTAAFQRFISDDQELFGLFMFTIEVPRLLDEAIAGSAKAQLLLKQMKLLEAPAQDDSESKDEHVVEEQQPGEDHASLEALVSGGGGWQEGLVQDHLKIFLTMIVVRGVDNFLTYVADLLKQIFLERPEALRSAETVRLDEVLQFGSMDDLVNFLAERRVDRLAYQSVNDLADNLEKALSFTLFETEAERARAGKLVATRNLLTHNRGVVNARFLGLVPNSGYVEGDQIELPTAIGEELDFLGGCARRIDARAIAKFSLTATGMPVADAEHLSFPDAES